MSERQSALVGRPPVEPLSERAWARVERGLWARVDAGEGARQVAAASPARRWKRLAVPGVAAAAIAVSAIALGRGLLDGPPRSAARFAPPSRVLSKDAPSSVTVDGVHVELDEHSALLVSHAPQAPGALIERGAAWFTVPPRDDRPPYIVAAGETTVHVIGTRFRVVRTVEDALVEVEHGTVEIHYRGTEVRIGGGQRWSSQRPATIVTSANGDGGAGNRAGAAPGAASAGPTGVPRPAAAPDADGAKYQQLQALEPRDPARAIEGYLELSRGRGRWVEPALYAAASLAAHRKDPRARRLLERYLTRFPRGRNADDVRLLLGLPRRRAR